MMTMTIRRPGLGVIMRTVADGSTTGVLALIRSQAHGRSSFAATVRSTSILLSYYQVIFYISYHLSTWLSPHHNNHNGMYHYHPSYIHSTVYSEIFRAPKCHLITTISTQKHDYCLIVPGKNR